ncbi:hypothetical protein PVT71_02760 [Salipiger sp. H15]|uniref:N-acetyltransferase domain-containing protein n=1 Tax=Alloyangia sp. H15 TaxID=3029062 RepID=A0AAU8AHY6_9RHOB
MIRRALPGEEAALDAFLADHAETSMFLRGNLAAAGLGDSTHRLATTCHVWPAAGPIRAVFGRTPQGYLMCQAPDAPPEVFGAYAEAIGESPVASVTGPPGQSAALIAALGFAGEDFRLNHVEPLYRLDLAALPACDDRVRIPSEEDVPLLAEWFFDYAADIGVAGRDDAARKTARDRAEHCAAGRSLRLLIEDGTPVAMSDVNAEVADIVQVGGVFVPQGLRNAARGRRVVQAQLLEARARGIRSAVLFANNPAAARAYEAIGFGHVGGYRVAVLHRPQPARARA